MGIWPDLGQENARTDTWTIQRNVRAELVGWWGQELDVARYALDRNQRPTVDTLQSMEQEFGSRIVGFREPGYAGLAWNATANVILSMTR